MLVDDVAALVLGIVAIVVEALVVGELAGPAALVAAATMVAGVTAVAVVSSELAVVEEVDENEEVVEDSELLDVVDETVAKVRICALASVTLCVWHHATNEEPCDSVQVPCADT
mmetsp:Transcript_20507/g.47784  ORF Transcript_20507/g.47784 Transcript_20507/m.47784 type:complete len:114 (+) Transcript_20507:281-622(+)